MAVEWVETREVPVGELTKFPGNAKRGDIGTIRESVRRTGQYRSLVVRLDGDDKIILAGNHTYDALVAEGRERVRVELIRCSPTEATRINLADNRVAELGSYDDETLVDLLLSLDGDLVGSGWTADDVDRLVDYDSVDQAIAEADGEPSAPDDFPSYDTDIKTDYCCPKCGYEWSGKPR